MRLHRIWNICWKWGPADRFTVNIHIVQKSKMAAATIGKSAKGNNSTIFEWIRTNFEEDTENKVPGNF